MYSISRAKLTCHGKTKEISMVAKRFVPLGKKKKGDQREDDHRPHPAQDERLRHFTQLIIISKNRG